MLFVKRIDKAAALDKTCSFQHRQKKSQVLYMLICVPYLLIYENVNVWWIYTGIMELNINSTEGPKSHLD